MKNLLSILFLAAALMVVSCGKDDGGDDGGGTGCDTTGLNYTDDIKTILDASCALSGCHSAAQASTGTGALNDYANAKSFVDTRQVVKAINHEDGVLPMPYPIGADKLSQCSIDKITAWIADGAPE